MKLFTPSLLNPRDVAIIAAITIVAHIAARPLFAATAVKKEA